MALRMSEEEFADFQRLRRTLINKAAAADKAVAAAKPKKRSKYGNRRVEIDGMKFDSRHEADEYQYLMMRVKLGELKMVLRQVPFDLPGGIRYIADFVTVTPDGKIEGVYDAKSEITRKNRVYINKKKQLRALYGIEIVEV